MKTIHAYLTVNSWILYGYIRDIVKTSLQECLEVTCCLEFEHRLLWINRLKIANSFTMHFPGWNLRLDRVIIYQNVAKMFDFFDAMMLPLGKFDVEDSMQETFSYYLLSSSC